MMKNRMNHIKNKKSGYTLVEMVVVLLILGILAGLAIGGLLSYQKHAAFKKNNEYAKTIFLSAQNALTNVKTTGQIDDLEEDLKKINAKVLKKSDIQNAYEKQFPEERIYSVIFEKSERKSLSGVEKKIYDLVTPYIYDEDILDATFSIEFDPVDGTVWGVCYNDRASTFGYNRAQNTTKDNNISKRKESDRKSVLLGYYGADMLSDRPPNGGKDEVIEKAELINEDTLRVAWTIGEKYKEESYDYTFRMNLTSDLDSVYEFKISKEEIKKVKGAEPVEIFCDVKKPDGTVQKEIGFPVYIEKEAAAGKDIFNLILDAVDLDSALQLKSEKPDYNKTYSILRLFPELLKNQNEGKSRAASADMQAIGSLNLSVELQAVNDDTTSKWIKTNIANALFGAQDVQDADNTATGEKVRTAAFYIDNVRHLYNVRFTEEALKEANAKNGKVNYTYRQQSRKVDKGQLLGDKLLIADIIWTKAEGETESNGIVENGWVFNKKKRVVISEKEPASTVVFPVIAELGVKSTYTGVGSPSDPKLTDESTDKDVKYSIKGLNLFSGDQDKLGLFAKNSGVISTVSMITTKVSGSKVKYVGSVCGVNAGALVGVSTDKTSVITGGKYVGGIAGTDVTGVAGESVGMERTYSELNNAAMVSGDSYVGGIVGFNYTSSAVGKSGIKACVNTGFIQSSKEEGICIGGIVGYNREAPITESSSNPTPKSAYNNDNIKENMKGYFVGGIVGFNRGGEITKVKTGSDTAAESGLVTGYKYVGGIAGISTKVFGNSSVETESQLTAGVNGADKSVSKVNVAGDSYVGGVLGTYSKMGTNNSAMSMEQILNGTISPNGSITERSGYAGDSDILTGWEYSGTIYASANAGGITGYSNQNVSDCKVESINFEGKSQFGKTGATSLDVANLGGIVGANNGTVSSCTVTSVAMSINGGRINHLGGITGVNYPGEGTIVGVSKSNVDLAIFKIATLKETVSADASYIGGIVGNNGNEIEECTVKEVSFDVEVKNYMGRANVQGYGGAAGYMPSGSKAVKCNVEKMNVKLTGGTSLKAGAIGGSVGLSADSIVQECKVGTVEIDTASDAEASLGGVAGYFSGGSIDNSKAELVRGRNNVGGIVENNSGIISNSNTGTVTGTGSNVGGIANTNSGSISSSHASSVSGAGDNVGGIVAINTGNVNGCSTLASGSVTGRDNVGGIIGVQRAASAMMDGLQNFSAVTGKNNVGGIIGLVEQSLSLSVSSNSGDISSATNGGGIIGTIGQFALPSSLKQNISIETSSNWGSLLGSGSNRGGIVGKIERQNQGESPRIDIMDCVNTGAIEQPSKDLSSAGIVGNSLFGNAASERLAIIGCDNYGMPTSTAQHPMSGILGSVPSEAVNSDRVTVTDCYGVAPCGYPISSLELVDKVGRENKFFVNMEPMALLPPNDYPTTNGKWGAGVPLYTLKNGNGKYDAYTVEDNTKTDLLDMTYNPVELKRQTTIAESARISKVYYENLNPFIRK